MRKLLITAAATVILCSPALAQDNMSDGMSKSTMSSPMNANGKMMMRHHSVKHHMMKKKMMNNGMMHNGMKE